MRSKKAFSIPNGKTPTKEKRKEKKQTYGRGLKIERLDKLRQEALKNVAE